ncbi:MAG: sigma-54-dependent Fis family transcriptional regulator [Betaproteobacteria bacterium]|nr:sigma-54-dependent Fis family transcriptional regulator [Betaproteobacteria bacterium]
MPNTVLVVDDEPFNLDLLEQELSDRGYVVVRAAGGVEALEKVTTRSPQLVILDYLMPDMDGIEVLKRLRRDGVDIPVIMVTAHGTIEKAVEAMKHGATDFITKPFDADHLAFTVARALHGEKLGRKVEILSQEADERYSLITGDSVAMKQAVDSARKAAGSRSTVLLLGESGTGKEVIARAIQRWSDRRDEPFIAINCAGLSRELLESELFGHEKGAFTGAHQLKKGKMELAQAGTVFLDEVGDMAPELQARLLRFLQERRFERVGGTRSIEADVRIIVATNRDLEQAVRQGSFREDLYYRINVVAIRLPPLRERKGDIAMLAHYFLQRFATETKKTFTGITGDAMARLVAHDWPGNVRELANAIEHAVVLGRGPEVTVRDLPANLGADRGAAVPDTLSYHAAIDACKREVIVAALATTGGNRAAAAKVLGLQRTYLSRLIRSLGIN